MYSLPGLKLWNLQLWINNLPFHLVTMRKWTGVIYSKLEHQQCSLKSIRFLEKKLTNWFSSSQKVEKTNCECFVSIWCFIVFLCISEDRYIFPVTECCQDFMGHVFFRFSHTTIFICWSAGIFKQYTKPLDQVTESPGPCRQYSLCKLQVNFCQTRMEHLDSF